MSIFLQAEIEESCTDSFVDAFHIFLSENLLFVLHIGNVKIDCHSNTKSLIVLIKPSKFGSHHYKVLLEENIPENKQEKLEIKRVFQIYFETANDL